MTRFEDLPARIQRHLESVTESSGLPPGKDSLARITANWIEKRDLFAEQTALLDMQELDELAPDDPRGVLVLTYSGSLLSLGPAEAAAEILEVERGDPHGSSRPCRGRRSRRPWRVGPSTD